MSLQGNQTKPEQTHLIVATPQEVQLPQLIPFIPCHVDGSFVFQIGQARIHAGGMAARLMTPAWDLVINLTGNSQMSPVVTGFNGAQQITPQFISTTPEIPGYPELVIDWSDGGTPHIQRDEWQKLVEDLTVFDGDVLVHCMGGHGRTGTLLVILGVLSGVLKDVDPVRWVRNRYCKKSVETAGQIAYLQTHMQVETKELPRYLPFVPTSKSTQTLSSWWTQEEYNLTKPNLPPMHADLSGTSRCVLCMVHKKISLMHSTFMDGTGYCFSCNAEASARMERF